MLLETKMKTQLYEESFWYISKSDPFPSSFIIYYQRFVFLSNSTHNKQGLMNCLCCHVAKPWT